MGGVERACCEECAREATRAPSPVRLELITAARKNTRKYPPTSWSEQRLYRPYVRWALVIGLLLGFATGAGMLLVRGFGVTPGLWWVTHAQGHGAAQIFGFAGLFTMGVAFHVVPRFRNGSIAHPRPQRAALMMMATGIILRFTGQSISSHPGISGPILALSGVLVMASILVFAVVVGRALAGGTARRGPADRWLAMGIGWGVLAGALHLAVTARMAASESVIAYGPWNNAMIYGGLVGFIGCFILGVSTRTVPGFLGLGHTRVLFERAAFVLVNGGLLTGVTASLLGAPGEVRAAGMIVVAAGLVSYVAAIRVLEPALSKRPPLPGAYRHYSLFIRSAYLWLLVYAALVVVEYLPALGGPRMLPAGQASPAIHVLTLGFITSMIIGMGSRMIPLFEGSVIRGHRMLDVAWVALTGSVVLRVLFGFIRPGADEWLAASGVLGLFAISVFAWMILTAMSSRAREKYRRQAGDIGRVRWQSAARQPSTAGSSAGLK